MASSVSVLTESDSHKSGEPLTPSDVSNTRRSFPTEGEDVEVTDNSDNQISFVAKDLVSKIQKSRSMESSDGGAGGSSMKTSSSSYSTSSSASSIPNSLATSVSSQFPLSPADVPEIDPKLILDIEKFAESISHQLDEMISNLNKDIQRMSAISVGCLQTYNDTVDKTCEGFDVSIKSMYAVMAKYEELSKNMQPMYAISAKIKKVRKLVELFEQQLLSSKDG